VKSYIAKQITEIASSLELRIAGAGLFLIHVATQRLWLDHPAMKAAAGLSDGTCWPMLPNCSVIHVLTMDQWSGFFNVYAGLALLGSLLILIPRTVGIAWALMVLVNVMKVFLLWQDYRFMGNYHYMPFVATAVFLFVGQKAWSFRWILVAFYLSAAALKFNVEWLTGSAIPAAWMRPDTPPVWAYRHGLTPLMCAYVVVLETIIVLGLLSKNRWIFTFSFSQIVVFHLFSYYIVGWFYPTIMACLLIVFPIGMMFKAHSPRPTFSFKDPKYRVPIAALIVYAMMQLVPALIPGDAALTGEGRMWSVNMFDSLPICYSKAIATIDSEKIDVSATPEESPKMPRTRCDPWFYFEKAKRRCAIMQDAPGFKGISLSLVSRKDSDKDFRMVIEAENVCAPEITYSTLFSNSWIKK
jgi:hypothetical protein